MYLRHTSSLPHIYYVHSERDLAEKGACRSFGLAAGYLSTRPLSFVQKNTWAQLFNRHWKTACATMAEGIREIGVDFFTIVPCSRSGVADSIRDALRVAGITELPELITKSDASVSFAGKNRAYIAQNSLIRRDFSTLGSSSKLVICDDFSETGNTLYGLNAAISSMFGVSSPEIILASVGISERLAVRSS